MLYKDRLRLIVITALSAWVWSCTPGGKKSVSMREVQLTSGLYGHMLNSAQVFSPDDEWVVYDIRNDQTHIGRTCCIEKVNVRTGEVVRLYSAPEQSLHGPGVGAASYHPREPKIIFIHGLLNCNEDQPYGFTRRFGALLDETAPAKVTHAEARTIREPLVAGALRGGTHAHSWSADGKWISFTYNDALMEKLEQTSGVVKDLRTIGVMAPSTRVTIPQEDAENFSGEYFSIVAATVTENPQPGSDQIEKALDECWIGTNGYLRKDGTVQRRAIAFQGQIRDKNDSSITEIFISDIPDDITQSNDGNPVAGTLSTRPRVPRGLNQRRITFTSGRKFPGVQGPRFWLRSSPDGALLYFLAKDDEGVVQIYEVPSTGGDLRQVTRLKHPVQAQFNVSPNGQSIALIADNSIWVTDIPSGELLRLTPRTPDDNAPVFAVIWNHQGNSLVFNRYVKTANQKFLQICSVAVQ